MTTRVAIIGASGKMGRLIDDLIATLDDFEVVARLGSASALDEMVAADVAVDVTVPAVSQSVVEFAVAHGIPTLVGTSGWSADRLTSLTRAVAEKPGLGVIVIPNFSIASVLATSFATTAARFFDSIEIVEAHNASKVDSPSGTAVRTAELIGKARAERGPVIAPHADQRARGQQVSSVPIHSLRMDGVVAQQDVIFGGTGETLTISHVTVSPDSYRYGIALALRALPTAEGVVVGLDQLVSFA
ncbi:MAG: 4-hydroxy-tetrahydrodipicolinate reductase [Actinomycetota bacterium]